jgi:hypothetical protein
MATFEFESLTIEDVETIEHISGRAIDSIMDDESPKGKTMKAIVFVVKKKENPMYTLDDAGKVSFKEAMELLQSGDADPKETSEN